MLVRLVNKFFLLLLRLNTLEYAIKVAGLEDILSGPGSLMKYQFYLILREIERKCENHKHEILRIKINYFIIIYHLFLGPYTVFAPITDAFRKIPYDELRVTCVEFEINISKSLFIN